MDEGQNETHKSGFVAVMGRPNVGKSTLINQLMGQKIAAVSPRPQTTRRRQLGILTRADAQLVFIDTPGVHKPQNKLGESMNQAAREALEDADVVLFVVDGSQSPQEEDRLLADQLTELADPPPVILALNKTEQLTSEEIAEREAEYRAIIPNQGELGEDVSVRAVSALRGRHLTELVADILERIPEGPPFYPEGQVTDLYEREIAGDLIREAALIHLRDEVPHGITVRVDEFTERGEDGAYIEATIIVERESHKGIVIGQGGAMLKQIGSDARREIEAMSGRKVFLRLRVKVRKNWRNDEKVLRWYGY